MSNAVGREIQRVLRTRPHERQVLLTFQEAVADRQVTFHPPIGFEVFVLEPEPEKPETP